MSINSVASLNGYAAEGRTLGHGSIRTSDEPASDALAITPSDSTDLSEVPRAIYIGAGGTLRIVTVAGATLDLTVYDGQTLNWACIARVKSTATTATGMVALY